MEICHCTLLIYADDCYFFVLEMNIYGFLKMRGIRMTKNVSGNKFVSFAFKKYCLYYKHRKRRIYCMSLVVH